MTDFWKIVGLIVFIACILFLAYSGQKKEEQEKEPKKEEAPKEDPVLRSAHDAEKVVIDGIELTIKEKTDTSVVVHYDSDRRVARQLSDKLASRLGWEINVISYEQAEQLCLTAVKSWTNGFLLEKLPTGQNKRLSTSISDIFRLIASGERSLVHFSYDAYPYGVFSICNAPLFDARTHAIGVGGLWSLKTKNIGDVCRKLHFVNPLTRETTRFDLVSNDKLFLEVCQVVEMPSITQEAVDQMKAIPMDNIPYYGEVYRAAGYLVIQVRLDNHTFVFSSSSGYLTDISDFSDVKKNTLLNELVELRANRDPDLHKTDYGYVYKPDVAPVHWYV